MLKQSIPMLIAPGDIDTPFPDVEQALREPDGLLAIGADLSPQRLINAYSHGIFPWYSDDQPILWWSPDPRLVLFPKNLHVPKSLRKKIRQQPYTITFDQAFEQVIWHCSQPRTYQAETWITDEMRQAYCHLHQLGMAHSVEAWQDNELVGGLYGVALGKIFFGESMFARSDDASKIAFVYLVKQLTLWDYQAIDCQVHTDHLARFGAETIPRTQLIAAISQWGHQPVPATWTTTP